MMNEKDVENLLLQDNTAATEMEADEEFDERPITPDLQNSVVTHHHSRYDWRETLKPKKHDNISRHAELFRLNSCFKNAVCTITTNMIIDLPKFSKK